VGLHLFVDESRRRSYLLCAAVVPSADLPAARRFMRALKPSSWPTGPQGERAIKILGYSTKKITKTDPDTGDEVEDRLVRYPVLSVFDISQTDGDPIPADSYRLPTGDGPDGALDTLRT
jgi:hypothetical protein